MKSQNCINEWLVFLPAVQSVSWGSPWLLACPYSWSSPIPATCLYITCIGNSKQLCPSHRAQVTKTQILQVSQSLTCRYCRQDLENCCDIFWSSMLSEQEEEARKRGHLKSLKCKNPAHSLCLGCVYSIDSCRQDIVVNVCTLLQSVQSCEFQRKIGIDTVSSSMLR